MKLLVTGGAGFIGSIVASRLLAGGHEVVIADDFSRGHREAVPPEATLVRADITDRHEIASVLFGGFDAVLHFAALALVGESTRHPERYWRTNVGGTLNLLEAMAEVGAGRLVFSSTAAVYGEPDEVPITEEAPTRPVNAYGASKLAVDQMISSFAAAHALGAVSLRYFNVAGAADGLGEDHRPETHLIPNILRVAAAQEPHLQVFGDDYSTPDGTCIRDYVHIEDLADAHILALDAPAAGEHRIYNLGNGEGFSVREVVDAARNVTGHPIPTVDVSRRPGDPARLVASADKIRGELGWQPRKPAIETIVSDAWEWAKTHPGGYGSS